MGTSWTGAVSSWKRPTGWVATIRNGSVVFTRPWGSYRLVIDRAPTMDPKTDKPCATGWVEYSGGGWAGWMHPTGTLTGADYEAVSKRLEAVASRLPETYKAAA